MESCAVLLKAKPPCYHSEWRLAQGHAARCLLAGVLADACPVHRRHQVPSEIDSLDVHCELDPEIVGPAVAVVEVVVVALALVSAENVLDELRHFDCQVRLEDCAHLPYLDSLVGEELAHVESQPVAVAVDRHCRAPAEVLVVEPVQVEFQPVDVYVDQYCHLLVAVLVEVVCSPAAMLVERRSPAARTAVDTAQQVEVT